MGNSQSSNQDAVTTVGTDVHTVAVTDGADIEFRSDSPDQVNNVADQHVAVEEVIRQQGQDGRRSTRSKYRPKRYGYSEDKDILKTSETNFPADILRSCEDPSKPHITAWSVFCNNLAVKNQRSFSRKRED